MAGIVDHGAPRSGRGGRDVEAGEDLDHTRDRLGVRGVDRGDVAVSDGRVHDLIHSALRGHRSSVYLARPSTLSRASTRGTPGPRRARRRTRGPRRTGRRAGGRSWRYPAQRSSRLGAIRVSCQPLCQTRSPTSRPGRRRRSPMTRCCFALTLHRAGWFITVAQVPPCWHLDAAGRGVRHSRLDYAGGPARRRTGANGGSAIVEGSSAPRAFSIEVEKYLRLVSVQ